MLDINLSKNNAVTDILPESLVVLKNTYKLLSITLIFSALMALLSVSLGIGQGAALMLSVLALATIFFILPKVKDDERGIIAVFGITGLLGASLGPILNRYLGIEDGSTIIFQSFLGSGIVFFALSGYALKKKTDFSQMGAFLFSGLIVILLALIGNIFFQSSALELALSAMIVMLMCGYILYDTSEIIHGRQTNYVLATVSIYLNLHNLFVSLLHLLGSAQDD